MFLLMVLFLAYVDSENRINGYDSDRLISERIAAEELGLRETDYGLLLIRDSLEYRSDWIEGKVTGPATFQTSGDTHGLKEGRIVSFYRHHIPQNDYWAQVARVEEGNLIRFSENVFRASEMNSTVLIAPLSTEQVVQVYRSSAGFQGEVFQFLSDLGVRETLFRLFTSLLLALTLTGITYLVFRKYGTAFAVSFYLVFLLSPWITDFANSTYWFTFSLFLPMLAGLLVLNFPRKFYLTLPFLFGAVLLKCLFGYEFISSIMCSAVMFLIYAFIREPENRKRYAGLIISASILGIAAFLTALYVHVNIEGTFENGLNNIVQIMNNRTITGDTQDVDGVFASSIRTNVLEVLIRYLFLWRSYMLFGLHGILFFPLVLLGCFGFALNRIRVDRDYSDLLCLLVFMAGPLSWFILAKPHSAIHVHINYILWYLGFIQFGIYYLYKKIKHTWSLTGLS